MSATLSTQVVIIGAGPAGLMTSHLLSRSGIDNVVLESRTREQIEGTQRAGMLEPGSADLLVRSGVSDRVLRDGVRHDGVRFGFDGELHRLDLQALLGTSLWLYPQTEVFIDLAEARARDGGDVRFGVSQVQVLDVEHPRVAFTDDRGADHEVTAQILVGADGAHSPTRRLIPEGLRQIHFRHYPFAWLGLLIHAPAACPEVTYHHSPDGFALLSHRTTDLQRWYLQCSPEDTAADWPDERVLAQLRARCGANGQDIAGGVVLEKSVLGFRSMVVEPVQHANLVLIGDAAHTVPPTGAKGLNLALRDAAQLANALEASLLHQDRDALTRFTDQVLPGTWEVQQFSYWMTTLLHRLPDDDGFDLRRQQAQLRTLFASESGRRLLAEGYTGRTPVLTAGRGSFDAGPRSPWKPVHQPP